MTQTFARTIAIVLHAVLNVAIISYLVDYDITGNWFRIIGFVILSLILLVLFARHLFSYISFLKSK